MDLSFLRRAEARFADHSAARIDYALLVAMLAGHQKRSPAAIAQSAADDRIATVHATWDSLIDILIAAPRWRQAAAARCGSFHPAYAGFGMAA